MRAYHLAFLVLAMSCTSRVAKKEPLPSETPPSSTTPKPDVSTSLAPKLILPENAPMAMIRGKELFNKYLTHEDLYLFVRSKVPSTLSGGNETSRDNALKRTIECFKNLPDIRVRFKNYGVWPLYKSNAIGGWDGVQINQNPRHPMTPEETAGHWAHELTHACNFTHIDNNINRFPIIRNSWPYQFGYAVEDFISEKEARTLAGQQ